MSTDATPGPDSGRSQRAASLVSAGIFISRISGLIRTQLTAAVLGGGGVAPAFFQAAIQKATTMVINTTSTNRQEPRQLLGRTGNAVKHVLAGKAAVNGRSRSRETSGDTAKARILTNPAMG